MADRIVLKGLSARGHHGVLDEERRDGQTFVVDAILEVDLGPAGASDRLADTVSYAEVAGDIVELVEGEPLDLIEALAARIADRILDRPLVEAVEVVVHKPQAPVGHPFDDVHVQVRRERSEPVVIALGANLGNAAATLGRAVEAVAALRGVRVQNVSSLYQSEPVGGPEQPRYTNAVLLATTSLTPRGLLAALHVIEAGQGRMREERWGPRTLDLDLIQYGDPRLDRDVRSDDPHLTLPHPRAHERAFVLVPWLEVEPAAVLRVDGVVRRVADLAPAIDRTGLRRSTARIDERSGRW
jgi:dihydroneopterin aldolase/2-amino-4-hydroxy-6-hydroxymethyldihydropteridine diphosphokinase